MFGIQLIELISFGRQAGLALAGAACLWGLVFYIKGRRDPGRGSSIAYEWVSQRLFYLLGIGFFLAAGGWMATVSIMEVFAHEGIKIHATDAEVVRALRATTSLFLLWVAVFFIGNLVRVRNAEKFHQWLPYFYGIQLILISVLISLPAIADDLFSARQFFFIGHSIHSIMTLGTVLTLDFLFIISKPSEFLKQHIYPLFPTISKIILIGLGLDFLSVALVFDEALALTPRFFFMQTVVGILIINGVLLAGPITKRMIDSVREGGAAMSRKWETIGDACGTISIVSWTTITFVDFMDNLTVDYAQMVGAYLSVIAVLFFAHLLAGPALRFLGMPVPAFLETK